MKYKALISVSFGLNIVALSYIFWIHQHPEMAAQDQEKQAVQKWEPQVRSFYRSIGVSSMVANPTTLDELLQPLPGIASTIVSHAKSDDGKP